MVSAALLKRLHQTIDVMERRARPKRWRSITVTMPNFLDRQQVMAKHYELFAEDRDPNVVMVRTYLMDVAPWMTPANIANAGRAEKAAWSVIADERQKHSEWDLRRMWALRAIQSELKDVRENEKRFVASSVGAIAVEHDFPDDEAISLLGDAGIDMKTGDIAAMYARGKSRQATIGARLCLIAHH